MAQQRCESAALVPGGRTASKVKSSNIRRHTASVPTILTRPASPRNPQLSPLQSWWGLQQWGGPAEVVAACLLHPHRVTITRSTPHCQRWAWSPRGRNVLSSKSLLPSKASNQRYSTDLIGFPISPAGRSLALYGATVVARFYTAVFLVEEEVSIPIRHPLEYTVFERSSTNQPSNTFQRQSTSISSLPRTQLELVRR